MDNRAKKNRAAFRNAFIMLGASIILLELACVLGVEQGYDGFASGDRHWQLVPIPVALASLALAFAFFSIRRWKEAARTTLGRREIAAAADSRAADSTTVRDVMVVLGGSVILFELACLLGLFHLSARPRSSLGAGKAQVPVALAFLSFAFAGFAARRWRELRREVAVRRTVEKQLREHQDVLTREAEERQQELRGTQESFTNLVQSSADGMLVIDRDGVVLYANPAARKLYGNCGAPVGAPFRFPLVPDAVTEVNIRRPDGETRTAEVRVTQTLWDRRPARLAMLRDITERKRVQAALRHAEAELAVAREVQEGLFPKSTPAWPGFDIAGACIAAETTAGDYYDYIPLPDGTLGAIVGDVSGHGLGSSLLMAEMRACLHTLAVSHTDPGRILSLANRLFVEDTADDRFMTLFFAHLDPHALSLSYASAAHEAYLIDSPGGQVTVLESTSCPLGLNPTSTVPPAGPLRLRQGQLLLLLTDGILEARAPDGRLFGEQGALEVACAHRNASAQEIVRVVCRAAQQFCGNGPRLDDMTALAVKVEPSLPPPPH